MLSVDFSIRLAYLKSNNIDGKIKFLEMNNAKDNKHNSYQTGFAIKETSYFLLSFFLLWISLQLSVL